MSDTETERVPLGDVFVGTGECAIRYAERWVQPKHYGPFLNPDVAHAWACDAFGRDGQGTLWTIVWFDAPWRVPMGERKS